MPVELEPDALAEIFADSAPFTEVVTLTNGAGQSVNVRGMILEDVSEEEAIPTSRLRLQLRTADLPSWLVAGGACRAKAGGATYLINRVYNKPTGLSLVMLGVG